MGILKKAMLVALSIIVVIAMSISLGLMESVYADTSSSDATNISYIKSTEKTAKSVELEWADVSSDADYQTVVMNKKGSVIKTQTVSDNETVVKGLKQNTKYKFRVVAKTRSTTAQSATITVKTKKEFAWPTSRHTVWSKFGRRSGYGSSFHLGIDIGVGSGTKVKAAKAGKVTKAGWYYGYGKCVKISHGDGTVTLYGHLSKIKVHKGQRVSQGQLIAKSGSTGQVTAPHLHFEIIKNGKHKNPLKYL